jgi:hypothetical protein
VALQLALDTCWGIPAGLMTHRVLARLYAFHHPMPVVSKHQAKRPPRICSCTHFSNQYSKPAHTSVVEIRRNMTGGSAHQALLDLSFRLAHSRHGAVLLQTVQVRDCSNNSTQVQRKSADASFLTFTMCRSSMTASWTCHQRCSRGTVTWCEIWRRA